MKRYLILLLVAILFCYSCSKKKNTRTASPTDKPYSTAIRYYHRADSFYFKSHFDSSYYYYNKALKIFLKHQDSSMIAKAYIDIGTLDVLFHNVTGGENNLVKAFYYLKDKDIDEKARAYNVLAINSKNKNDFDTAEKYFHLYRMLYLKKKDTLKEYVIYAGNLANLYFKKGQYKRAESLLLQLINNDTVKSQFPLKYARALNNLGNIYIKLNEPEKAVDNINKALEIRLKKGRSSTIVQSYFNLVQYYLMINDTIHSREFARKAMDLSAQTNSISNKMQAYSLLLKTSGALTSSVFEKYKKLNDSLLNIERKYKTQTALIKYETNEKEKQLLKQKQELELKNKRNKWLIIFLVVLLSAFLIFALQNKIITHQNNELSKKNFFINKLFQEMHHRIKNNFDIINKFITDVILTNENSSLVPYLKDLTNKVNSFKELHVLLKNLDISESYQVKIFVDKIFKSVKKSFGQDIKLENRIPEDVAFEFNKVIYLGLFINEFITNSFKYAFDDFDNATISVELVEAKEHYSLILKDNGKGLPDDYDWKNSNSLGMKYFFLITTYLKGNLSHNNENGLVFQLNFPK